MTKKKNAKFTHNAVKKKSTNKFNESDSLKEGKKHFLPMMNIDLDKLPSKGLPYPKEAIIKYRPYAWGEVKQISQSKMDKKDQFDFILDGIEVTNMQKDDLTLGDAIYLAIYRKISTVGGSQVTVQYMCDGCHKKAKGIFRTQDIKADKMKAPKLPMRVDFTSAEYAFMPMTIGDYFTVQDRLKTDDTLDSDFALLAEQCSNAKFDEVYQRLYNVSTQDEMDDIKDIDHFLNHGLQKIKNKCANVTEEKSDDSDEVLCGHVTEIELDGGQALILPFREDGERKRDRVRFGDET